MQANKYERFHDQVKEEVKPQKLRKLCWICEDLLGYFCGNHSKQKH